MPRPSAADDAPPPGAASREGELLRRAVQAFVGRQPDPALAEAARADLDWSAVLEVGRLSKLTGVAARGLELSGASLPQPVAARMADYRRRTMLVNSRVILTARTILPRLEAAGIDVLLFKGPVHQAALYEEHFLRPSSDIDLLVPPMQFDEAARVIGTGGFQLEDECASPWWTRFLGEQHFAAKHPSLATVDLHHKLQQPGCPSPGAPPRFLADKQRVALGAAQIPTLSANHACLLACMTLAKALVHRESAGAYACDIAAVVTRQSEPDRQALVAEATAQGLLGTLALGVRAAQALYEAPTLPGLRPVLPEVSDPRLAAMVLTPWDPELRWPRRLRILWELCDDKARSYLPEVGLMGAGEFFRMTTRSGPASRPEPPPRSALRLEPETS